MNILTTLLTISTESAAAVPGGIRFTTENLPTAMSFMLQGMSGIFIGLLAIYLCSIALQKMFYEPK